MQNAEVGVNNGGTPGTVPTSNGKQPGGNIYFFKFIAIVLATSCAVIYISSIITKARQERMRLEDTKMLLDKQVTRLRAEHNRLEKERASLQNDPIRIEKVARENLAYRGAGEQFYEKYNFRIKNTRTEEPEKSEPKSKLKTFLFEGSFPWQFPALIILISTLYYLITYYYEYRKLHKSNR